ncbi:DUF2334 domain-containing protein [Cohnella ginsengisoli]|uniref:DUF2334 domain-containing protein n=1 Tax=Cohnella ginsengisoli TaxID=425004 RepID=A0A9X4KF72_9BACL|nr:DUF2334 domain-containing protein [Cohnella ginsengisoli]MDG0791054.1 DUF2334 domain-containing protein [Cohnella ginsengisoli]
MNRKRWKWASIVAGGAAAAVAATVYAFTYTGTNIYPNKDKHHAMLRLEDIGPGGEYGTPEALGKLRAVLEYIESEGIPFQMAVIPRSIRLGDDGVWQERGIDDPQPDAVTQSLVRLLRQAEDNGGALGMHGYTHQYGETVMKGDGQNSGTGYEFKVPGASGTKDTGYAAARIESSLAAFEKAGLRPAFWESPHYRDTRAQEKVFRSYVGILYEPDLFSLRSFKDMNMYESRNTYGQDSLGSVYVPAPLSYITDDASVDKLLRKAKTYDGLASLFFHPFLEFPALEPVTGADGQTQMKDGLPVYRYKEDGAPSKLHKIVEGLDREGYRWLSLNEVVPFTPAQRVTLPLGTAADDVMTGDVTGSGHADVVVREPHRISVIPGEYGMPRNRPQAAAQVWLKAEFPPQVRLLLADLDADGKQDLVAYDSGTGAIRVSPAEDGRFAEPVSAGTLPAGLDRLLPVRWKNGKMAMLARSDGKLILFSYKDGRFAASAERLAALPTDAALYAGRFLDKDRDDALYASASEGGLSIVRTGGENLSGQAPVAVTGFTLKKGEQLLIGDTDGDGLDDLVAYAAKTGVWRVYANEGGGRFEPLDNAFGPWAAWRGRIGIAADFDGNGKADIAAYDPRTRALDLSLSFRNPRPTP